MAIFSGIIGCFLYDSIVLLFDFYLWFTFGFAFGQVWEITAHAINAIQNSMKTLSRQGGFYRLFPFSYRVCMKSAFHSYFFAHFSTVFFAVALCGVVTVGMTTGVIAQQSAFDQPVESAVHRTSPQASFISASGRTQRPELPLLSLEEALTIALEQNYGVRIARNATMIADNNAQGIKGLGAAGMLPNINLNGGWNESRDNVRQQFFNGNLQERAGARTDRANASVQLNWTLFDGLQMFAQQDRLHELQQQSDLALRQAIENTIAQVMPVLSNSMSCSRRRAKHWSCPDSDLLLPRQKPALEVHRS